MAATNAQVQAYVDQRVRPRCEQIRALYLAVKDDKASFDDIYANLNNAPTWDDSRSDNPPHLLTPGDVLGWNTFITGLIALVEGTAFENGAGDEAAACANAATQYPVVVKSCVRGV